MFLPTHKHKLNIIDMVHFKGFNLIFWGLGRKTLYWHQILIWNLMSTPDAIHVFGFS